MLKQFYICHNNESLIVKYTSLVLKFFNKIKHTWNVHTGRFKSSLKINYQFECIKYAILVSLTDVKAII